jgi:mRNA interferase HigB
MKRVVSPRRLREYASRYPTARPSLTRWLRIVQRAEWKNQAEVRENFTDADRVVVNSGRTVYVFNIEHNRHRLIAAIHFNTQTVYVLRIMPHNEYDRNRWKDEL